MAATPRQISTDEVAATLLEQALQGSLETLDQGVELATWPTIDFTLDGPQFEGTINASVAEAIVEAQRAVNNTYRHSPQPVAAWPQHRNNGGHEHKHC